MSWHAIASNAPIKVLQPEIVLPLEIDELKVLESSFNEVIRSIFLADSNTANHPQDHLTMLGNLNVQLNSQLAKEASEDNKTFLRKMLYMSNEMLSRLHERNTDELSALKALILSVEGCSEKSSIHNIVRCAQLGFKTGDIWTCRLLLELFNGEQGCLETYTKVLYAKSLNVCCKFKSNLSTQPLLQPSRSNSIWDIIQQSLPSYQVCNKSIPQHDCVETTKNVKVQQPTLTLTLAEDHINKSVTPRQPQLQGRQHSSSSRHTNITQFRTRSYGDIGTSLLAASSKLINIDEQCLKNSNEIMDQQSDEVIYCEPGQQLQSAIVNDAVICLDVWSQLPMTGHYLDDLVSLLRFCNFLVHESSTNLSMQSPSSFCAQLHVQLAERLMIDAAACAACLRDAVINSWITALCCLNQRFEHLFEKISREEEIVLVEAFSDAMIAIAQLELSADNNSKCLVDDRAKDIANKRFLSFGVPLLVKAIDRWCDQSESDNALDSITLRQHWVILKMCSGSTGHLFAKNTFPTATSIVCQNLLNVMSQSLDRGPLKVIVLPHLEHLPVIDKPSTREIFDDSKVLDCVDRLVSLYCSSQQWLESALQALSDKVVAHAVMVDQLENSNHGRGANIWMIIINCCKSLNSSVFWIQSMNILVENLCVCKKALISRGNVAKILTTVNNSLNFAHCSLCSQDDLTVFSLQHKLVEFAQRIATLNCFALMPTILKFSHSLLELFNRSSYSNAIALRGIVEVICQHGTRTAECIRSPVQGNEDHFNSMSEEIQVHCAEFLLKICEQDIFSWLAHWNEKDIIVFANDLLDSYENMSITYHSALEGAMVQLAMMLIFCGTTLDDLSKFGILKYFGIVLTQLDCCNCANSGVPVKLLFHTVLMSICSADTPSISQLTPNDELEISNSLLKFKLNICWRSKMSYTIRQLKEIIDQLCDISHKLYGLPLLQGQNSAPLCKVSSAWELKQLYCLINYCSHISQFNVASIKNSLLFLLDCDVFKVILPCPSENEQNVLLRHLLQSTDNSSTIDAFACVFNKTPSMTSHSKLWELFDVISQGIMNLGGLNVLSRQQDVQYTSEEEALMGTMQYSLQVMAIFPQSRANLLTLAEQILDLLNITIEDIGENIQPNLLPSCCHDPVQLSNCTDYKLLLTDLAVGRSCVRPCVSTTSTTSQADNIGSNILDLGCFSQLHDLNTVRKCLQGAYCCCETVSEADVNEELCHIASLLTYKNIVLQIFNKLLNVLDICLESWRVECDLDSELASQVSAFYYSVSRLQYILQYDCAPKSQGRSAYFASALNYCQMSSLFAGESADEQDDVDLLLYRAKLEWQNSRKPDVAAKMLLQAQRICVGNVSSLHAPAASEETETLPTVSSAVLSSSKGKKLHKFQLPMIAYQFNSIAAKIAMTQIQVIMSALVYLDSASVIDLEQSCDCALNKHWQSLIQALVGLVDCRRMNGFDFLSVYRISDIIYKLESGGLVRPNWVNERLCTIVQHKTSNTLSSTHKASASGAVPEKVDQATSAPGHEEGKDNQIVMTDHDASSVPTSNSGTRQTSPIGEITSANPISFAAALKELSKLFDKRRVQMVGVWFSDPPQTWYDEMLNCKLKFNNVRRKYITRYLELATLCNAYQPPLDIISYAVFGRKQSPHMTAFALNSSCEALSVICSNFDHADKSLNMHTMLDKMCEAHQQLKTCGQAVHPHVMTELVTQLDRLVVIEQSEISDGAQDFVSRCAAWAVQCLAAKPAAGKRKLQQMQQKLLQPCNQSMPHGELSASGNTIEIAEMPSDQFSLIFQQNVETEHISYL